VSAGCGQWPNRATRNAGASHSLACVMRELLDAAREPFTTRLRTALVLSRGVASAMRNCYRMLGSDADAEDAVQETWSSRGAGLIGFEDRGSIRLGSTRSPRTVPPTHAYLRPCAGSPRLSGQDWSPYPPSDWSGLFRSALKLGCWRWSRWSWRSFPLCSTFRAARAVLLRATYWLFAAREVVSLLETSFTRPISWSGTVASAQSIFLEPALGGSPTSRHRTKAITAEVVVVQQLE